MRDYGRVAPTFWTRGSGKKLRGKPHAQLVALYLFTSPASTMVGIYHLAIPTMAHEIGISPEEATAGLAAVCEIGIAKYDPDAELVYLPGGAKYQIGEQLKSGDLRVKGIQTALAQLNGHPFARDIAERYSASFCLTRGFEAPSKEHYNRHGSPFEAITGKDQAKQETENKNAVSNPPHEGSGFSSDQGPVIASQAAHSPNPTTNAAQTEPAPMPQSAEPSPRAAAVPSRPEPDAHDSNAAAGPKDPVIVKPDPVADIFAEYVTAWRRHSGGRRPPVLDVKRRRLTLDRLKTFSEDDLKSAARGVWKHPWNVENKQTNYDLVMRDSAHVERFMAAEESTKPKPPRAGVPEWLDRGRPSDRLVAYMKEQDANGGIDTSVDLNTLLVDAGAIDA